jgi:hypothetical protein
MYWQKVWTVLLGLAALLLLGAAACGDDSGDADDDLAGDAAFAGAGESRSENDGELRGRAQPTAEATSAASEGASAAPAAGESEQSGQEILPSAASLDRKIVSTAILTVEADAVSARYQDVATIAAGAGGYVSDSSFGREGDQETASVTVRVPVESYQDVLRQLRGMGNVVGESSSANDVTEEFTDLEARLRNLRATETQYLEFLGQAQNLEETLMMQDRINQVRGEIEQVQGRMLLLEQTTALATITVHLQPPPVVAEVVPPEEPKGERSLAASAEEAFDASVEFLEDAARVVISIGAFGWWIIPLGLVGVYFGRRARGPARAKDTSPEA